MAEHFTCALCGRERKRAPGWTEEDRQRELREVYAADAVPDPEDQVTICTPCYRDVLAHMKEKTPERLNLDALARFEEQHP